MSAVTQADLKSAYDANLPSLRNLDPTHYTGSWVGELGDGRQGVSIGFHPLTATVKHAALKLFAGYPVEVVDRPLASAQGLRSAQ